MTWAVVRGELRGGVVRPLEKIPSKEGAEVLILFPQKADVAIGQGVWQQIKQEIVRDMPDLLYMTPEERRVEFDRLSEKIAQNMPYCTLEEFEQAMRGDDYGLVRY